MTLKYTIKATANEIQLTETYAGREATLFALPNIDFGEARARAYRAMAYHLLEIATNYEFSPAESTIAKQIKKLKLENLNKKENAV